MDSPGVGEEHRTDGGRGVPPRNAAQFKNSYAVMLTLPDGQKLEIKPEWSFMVDIVDEITRMLMAPTDPLI